MFRGLTRRAHRIITLDAQREAQRYSARALEPEHVLVAMLIENAGTACRALQFLKVDLADMRSTLEGQLRASAAATSTFFPLAALPLSRRSQSLLESAVEEARRLDTDYVGTEHLLLAALRESVSAAARYLSEHGVELSVVRLVLQTTFAPRPEPVQPPSATPYLDAFSTDLCAQAAAGELDPVIGRDSEIRRTLRVLVRRTKNNPVLVGEPGTGKTAIVEGLAGFLAAGRDIPAPLVGKRLLSLDLGLMVAGTKYRGEFEERLKRLIKEALQDSGVILFIDEIHTLIGAGSASGSLDAANMLKPVLSRGKLQCIGATTGAEYRRYFERDGALERRFQPVQVLEPDEETCALMLSGLRARYEEHHRIRYADEALHEAARLAGRYIAGRAMPDKAIDLLDEAGAAKAAKNTVSPRDVAELEAEITRLLGSMNEMMEEQRYERAGELREAVRRLRALLAESVRDWQQWLSGARQTVSAEDIRGLVSEITRIPVNALSAGESVRLLDMEATLSQAVVGQSEAVKRVAAAIRRSRTGVSSADRPTASFLFAGPTGVGKTLMARTLANYLFGANRAKGRGQGQNFLRIDMSDFMEKHTVSRLAGAPPGYVGYEDGGVLTEAVRKNPYSVVLFDEIEKAHREVHNILLQILEEGELRDNLGHTVNFRNTVVIITSNAGARELSGEGRLGFAADEGAASFKDMEASAQAELRRIFSPEFLNRLDEVVVFQSLDRERIAQILDIHLCELSARLAAQGFGLVLKKSARALLCERGLDARYGARPLRRAVARELEEPLAVAILRGRAGEAHRKGTVFVAAKRGDRLHIRAQPPESEVPPAPPSPAVTAALPAAQSEHPS